MATTEEKLEACKEKRRFVSDCLYKVLKGAIEKNAPLSEAELKEEWLKEMRKNKTIFEDGWYMSPPHGVSVLFGTEKEHERNRINYKSIRPEEKWSRKDVFLDKKSGFVFAYASPVDKETGIIGDFCITLYFGKDPGIIDHLKSSYALCGQVFEEVKVGMQLKEIYSIAGDFIAKEGFVQDVQTITDKKGASNIGHTIPASYEEWKKDEWETICFGEWGKAKDVISKKRRFINNIEELKVKNGFALVIEIRPINPNNLEIPMPTNHAICLIHKNGSKELLTNHCDLFKLAGMDYMQEVLQ